MRVNGDLPMVSPSDAATSLSDDAELLVSGFGSVGYPKAVPLALAASDRDRALTVVSGGSVGDEIDTALVDADAIERRYPYQATAASRDAINGGSVAFQDYHVSETADRVQYGTFVDSGVALIEAIAVGNDWLIPSTSIGHTPAFVEAADRLIVEVNTAQPLGLQQVHDIYRPGTPPNRASIPLDAAGDRIGSPRVRFDPAKLEAVVRTDRADSPYSFREPTDDEITIASNFADFLREEVMRSAVFAESIHLQFGVGSLGNAMMSVLSDVDVDDRQFVYFGEVIQDGLLDMIDAGVLSSASAASLALSTEGQAQLFDNIEQYAESIVLRPADISNNPELIRRFGVMAVNSALEVDLYGHVNSTHIEGTRIVNGLGGSGDFNHNALTTVVVLPSTTADGTLSRIIPMVPHVDHTEHDIDVIVTEQGIADLRGCSPAERADQLVRNCAHPDIRSDLQAYLDEARTRGGHIAHDVERALSWRDAT